MVRRTNGSGGRVSGLQIVVLALVQGITEFLPISSQAHLILADEFFGWPDAGLLIRVAVHVGTLGAVMVYFRRDLWMMLSGLGRLAGGRDPGVRLALFLVIATVPVVAAGGIGAYYGVIDRLQEIEVIGWAMLGFGLLLYAADRFNMTIRRIEHLTLAHAVFIGVAQVLALIPGTSRSGITMTAARALGYERAEGARFSMLLSIPVIVAAGTHQGYKLYQIGDMELSAAALVAAGLAFVSALAAIGLMMAWLRRSSFTPFVIYRVALGAGLLWWAYTGGG